MGADGTALIGFGFTIVSFFDQLKKIGHQPDLPIALRHANLSPMGGRGLDPRRHRRVGDRDLAVRDDDPLPVERRLHADPGSRSGESSIIASERRCSRSPSSSSWSGSSHWWR
jgi:hypothetical protein